MKKFDQHAGKIVLALSVAIAVAFLSAFFLAQLRGDRTPQSTRELIEAASAGKIEIVEQLVGKGVAVDSENKMDCGRSVVKLCRASRH